MRSRTPETHLKTSQGERRASFLSVRPVALVVEVLDPADVGGEECGPFFGLCQGAGRALGCRLRLLRGRLLALRPLIMERDSSWHDAHKELACVPKGEGGSSTSGSPSPTWSSYCRVSSEKT